METVNKTRFWEIDTLRGIAIILMIFFHILWDLKYFNYIYVNLYVGFLRTFAYFVAAIFLVLVGISLTISYAKAQKELTKNKILQKFIFRGLYIFSLGLLITFVTWLYIPRGLVVFGVLHCIGISIILAYPFIKYSVHPFFLGLALIVLGFILNNFIFDFPWLLWLGFIPSNFYTLDYFPIIPWFGVVLIGISLGNTLYKNGVRKFALNDKAHLTIIKITTFLGRHSLVIYLLHQVILFAIFTLISFFKIL